MSWHTWKKCFPPCNVPQVFCMFQQEYHLERRQEMVTYSWWTVENRGRVLDFHISQKCRQGPSYLRCNYKICITTLLLTKFSNTEMWEKDKWHAIPTYFIYAQQNWKGFTQSHIYDTHMWFAWMALAPPTDHGRDRNTNILKKKVRALHTNFAQRYASKHKHKK